MADEKTKENHKKEKKDKKDKKKPSFGPENWSSPLKEGSLTKRGQMIKNWKHRYFRLQGGNLIYFEDIRSTKPKGVIPISGATINVMLTRSGDHQHCFEIVTPKRSFLISAASDADAEAWSAVLKKSAAGTSPGTSTEKKPRESSDPDLKDVEIIDAPRSSRSVNSNAVLATEQPRVSSAAEFSKARQIDDYSTSTLSATDSSSRRRSSGSGLSAYSVGSSSSSPSTSTAASSSPTARSRSGGIIRSPNSSAAIRKPPTPVSFALDGEHHSPQTPTPVVHLTPSPAASALSTVSETHVTKPPSPANSSSHSHQHQHQHQHQHEHKKGTKGVRRNVAIAIAVALIAIFVYLQYFRKL